MLAHLLARRLVDVDLEFAGSEGRRVGNYTWGEEATTSRSDGVVVDRAHPQCGDTRASASAL